MESIEIIDEQEAFWGEKWDGNGSMGCALAAEGGAGHVALRSASDIMRRLHGPETGEYTVCWDQSPTLERLAITSSGA